MPNALLPNSFAILFFLGEKCLHEVDVEFIAYIEQVNEYIRSFIVQVLFVVLPFRFVYLYTGSFASCMGKLTRLLE